MTSCFVQFDSPINKILYQETKVLVHSYFLKRNEFTVFSYDNCRDECVLKDTVSSGWLDNVTFTPGTCGYLCPTKVPKFGDIGDTLRDFSPHFYEYKVIKHFIINK